MALREHKNIVEYQPHENKEHVCDNAVRKMKNEGIRVTGWSGDRHDGIETEILITQEVRHADKWGRSIPGRGNSQGRDADQEEGN